MARQGAFITGSGGSANWSKGLSDSLSDMSKRFIDQKTAKDTQIFRQQQLANEGVRLGMLGDKNAYDMQGGERAKAAAEQVALTNAAAVDKAFGNSQATAEALAGTQQTAASNLAGVNATAAEVQDAHETATAAAAVQAQIAKENRGVTQAKSLRGVLLQEGLDNTQAALELDQQQRMDRTNLVDKATGGQIFSGLSDTTMQGVQDDPRFQAMYATQHPSDTTGVTQQQAFLNQMESDFQANPASYEDPNLIIKQVNELADSKGWDAATRQDAISQSLRDFTKLDSATAESQQKVVSENQKQLVDAITGNSADGNTGSKAQQGLIQKMYESGNAEKQQNYLKDWIDLHGNKQGESSNTTKLVEFIMPSEVNEKDASGANIQPLFAHFAGDGLTIPAVIQSLEGLGLVQGGSYTSMEPQDMLSDPKVLSQIKALAQDFQSTSGKGTGRSLSEVVGLVKAAQGDAAAERRGITGNQVFRKNSNENRLGYILSQLPGVPEAQTRATAARKPAEVVDNKILSGGAEVIAPVVAANSVEDTPVFSDGGGRRRPSIAGPDREELKRIAELEMLNNLGTARRTRSR